MTENRRETHAKARRVVAQIIEAVWKTYVQEHEWWMKKNCSQYRSTALLIKLCQPSTQCTERNQCVFYLAHAVVCELDVSFVVQENVVQLQIAVDDALFMQEVQSNTDFSSVKSVKEKREIQRMMCVACPLVSPSGQRFTLIEM